MVFLESFSDSWAERKERNPGYSGRTHTAARGAKIPAIKANAILTKGSI